MNNEYDESQRFTVRGNVLQPGEWETHYCWQPVYSIKDQLLYQQDAYKRLRHCPNPKLGYEYATLFEITAL